MAFRTTTILTSLALTAFCLQACGGEDKTKKAFAPDAGPDAAPDAAPDATQGDSSDQPDAEPDASPDASPDAEPDAEPDASPDAEPDAGMDAAVPPALDLLFTVEPGANGLEGSGVAAVTGAASSIFSSTTGQADPVDGTNEAVFTAEDLGLTSDDQLDAFTFLKPPAENPMYLFSVALGGNGGDYTRIRSSHDGVEASGDVYFSDGSLSHRELGEGGDQYGYQGLLADESSLGLATPVSSEPDNLRGLYVRGADEQLGDIYFSVSASSTGAAGTAVFTTDPVERGCTIYKSALDGTNTVAFSCADLGLLPDVEVDALAVLGDPDPTQILFSVESREIPDGLPGTPMELTTDNGAQIWQSSADGTHEELLSDHALGLERINGFDDVDALAVVDQPLPSFTYGATCTLAQDPLDPAYGDLSAVFESTIVGNSTLMLHGSTNGGDEGLVAFNAQTCAYVGTATLPLGSISGNNWVLAPLANWSAATPFSNVEYWVFNKAFDADAGVDRLEIRRLDDQGAAVNRYLFEPSDADMYSPLRLFYEPVGNRFFATMDAGFGAFNVFLMTFERPAVGAPEATLLTSSVARLPHPCSNDPVAGPDGLGHVIFAQTRQSGPFYRTCSVSPTAEFVLPPITQTPQIDISIAYAGYPMFSAGNSFVLYQEDADGGLGPFKVERDVFTPAP